MSHCNCNSDFTASGEPGRMLYLALFGILCASALADSMIQSYSYSSAVGSGWGQPFTLTGDGKITALRVWESHQSHIRGLQLRYDYIWSPLVGIRYGNFMELELFEGETVVQVSGKWSSYIQSLAFRTSTGRWIFMGQPHGNSFNMFPSRLEGELQALSGRYNGHGITSVAAHWVVPYKRTSTSD